MDFSSHGAAIFRRINTQGTLRLLDKELTPEQLPAFSLSSIKEEEMNTREQWLKLAMKAGNTPDRRALAPVLLFLALAPVLRAVENIPQKPFAQSVWLPEAKQFIVTPWYQYSEFYSIWRGSKRESIEVDPGHNSYGFDLNNGAILLEYGLDPQWAADLTLGYTSGATRSFNARGEPDTTEGLMDTTFGLRYQAFNEKAVDSDWIPTTTFRVGGIYRGTYHPDFPFAPGSGSVGIEMSALLHKSLGWEGFGVFRHMGFRSIRSGGNDQWFTALGLGQQIKSFTFNFGYRHFENTTGDDITGSGTTIVYSRAVREIKEEIQGGIGYTTAHRGIHYQFLLSKVLDGRNTGAAVTYLLFADLPIGK